MTENEKQDLPNAKQKIRNRYRGVDASELIIIPAKPPASVMPGAILRVAAYIRVSTDNDEQTSSYELQKNYFTEYILSQDGWILVGIYSDEGISGTQINHREGLQRLLEDCKAGKVDYIITKSISRFARNIVDCLNMIEELRNLKPPVGVIFETDHIDTLSGSDGLLLSILASLAEAESRNKSEIMNWSIENRFNRGIFLLPELLGYDKDEDGVLIINQDEALTVKLCFYLFLAGFSLTNIAETLTELQRKTGYNKLHNKKPGVDPIYNTEWTSGSVLEILRNERHCGDVLARKTFTPNFKNHKSVKNRGERAQVIKNNDHEGIVSREVFEAVNRKLDMTTGKRDRPYPIMKVIDDGVLKGFVPIDRNWKGFSSADYIAASKSAYDDVEEIDAPKVNSALKNFQVVRAQLFNTQLYPAISISDNKMRFNTACFKKFNDVEYVELLFNPVEKCIAVRPCTPQNPNAIRWGKLCNGKWTVLEKSCRVFSGPLYEVMQWDNKTRYRLRGSYTGEGENRMMIFDLEEPEVVERVPIENIPESSADNNSSVSGAVVSKQKYKSVISFSCNNTFGPTYYEEEQYLARVHYSGNWDVLRPAREVFGISPITEQDINSLLHEAERIINELRVTA